MRRLCIFAIILLLAWASSARADGGGNGAPGPCNTINVFTDTDELQDDIFDNFNIFPGAQIDWVRADRLFTWFTNRVKTGNITCTNTNSNLSLTINAKAGQHHAGEPLEPVVVPAHIDIVHIVGPTTTVTGPTTTTEVSVEPPPPATTLRAIGRAASVSRGRTLALGRYRARVRMMAHPSHRPAYRFGRSLAVEFVVHCRIQTNVGCA